jgi:hypothetical protein
MSSQISLLALFSKLVLMKQWVILKERLKRWRVLAWVLKRKREPKKSESQGKLRKVWDILTDEEKKK